MENVQLKKKSMNLFNLSKNSLCENIDGGPYKSGYFKK